MKVHTSNSEYYFEVKIVPLDSNMMYIMWHLSLEIFHISGQLLTGSEMADLLKVKESLDRRVYGDYASAERTAQLMLTGAIDLLHLARGGRLL